MLTGDDSQLCRCHVGPCSCADCNQSAHAKRRLEKRKWFWKTPGKRDQSSKLDSIPGKPANADDRPLLSRLIEGVRPLLFF